MITRVRTLKQPHPIKKPCEEELILANTQHQGACFISEPPGCVHCQPQSLLDMVRILGDIWVQAHERLLSQSSLCQSAPRFLIHETVRDNNLLVILNY